MFCPQCGTDNPEEARFCGKCAAPMPRANAKAQPAPWGAGATGSQPAVSSGLKTGIAITSVLLPIVGLVMGIMYMADANPEKKSAGKLWLLVACGVMVVYCLIGLALSTANR
jgi:uncharacterized membrane protein YvbJ